LEIADDRPARARCEKTRPERTGAVRADWRKAPERISGRDRQIAELPLDLLTDRLWAVRRGKPGGLGGVGGSTKGVRAHVSYGSGLPCCSSGGGRSRSTDSACRPTSDEPTADLACDAKLATGKGARPGDRISRTAVMGSFGLEQSQYSFRAVRRPRRDDPTFSLAQRLNRTHAQSLALAIAPPTTARAHDPNGDSAIA
jgi:hypothetical protein